jgi:hypothetical protein
LSSGFFEDGSLLSVYNQYNMSADKDELVGKRIMSIEETDTHIRLNIESDKYIYVDLSDSAYYGPEALQFNTKDGVVIVWN